MKRRLQIESLEDRMMLAVSTASCDLPFTSAVNLLESEELVFNPAVEATSTEYEYYVGTFYDVNKYWKGDGQLCWAAATSNILAYTNWGYSVFVSGDSSSQLFEDEYAIYDYFFANFTNEGGNAFYGIPWFTIGEYGVTGKSGWSQPIGDGGNLFPGTPTSSIRVYLNYQSYSDTLIDQMAGYLQNGYGVAMSIGWYQSDAPKSRSGGHSLTVWGYTYNPDLDPANPNYYTGLILSNSDDHQTATVTMALEWNEEYKMYRLSDYSSGTGWIEDFICLKSVTTLEGITAAGYNGVYDGTYHSVTVTGADSETDTIVYYYNETKSQDPPSFLLPGTYTVSVLVVRDNFDSVWSAPVTITIGHPAPEPLSAPALISAESNGANTQKLEWTEITDAVSYELAWSSDGTAWQLLTTDNYSAVISNLPYGAAISYKVRALGNGTDYSNSEWSKILTQKVIPMDIDGDGFIGPGDRSLISFAWFTTEGDENWDPRCDIDGDGFIGPGDLSFLSANWFKTEDDDLIYPEKKTV